VNPVIARVLAAVGVVLSVVSIWTPLTKSAFGPTPTYWNVPGHGLGIALLVLAILAALGLLLATVLGHPIFDRLWLLAGTTAGGIFLFYPIVVTSASSASELRAAGWLGAAAFIVFVVAGALLPLSPASQSGAVLDTPAAPATPPSVEPSESAPDEPESDATDT
jgi:hypothetical protein